MRNVVRIKDNPGLVKDTKTHAVLSVDNAGLKAYKKQRARDNQHITMLDDINSIKQELGELRDMCKSIISKL